MNPIYSRTNGTHGFKESKGCTFYSYTSAHSVPLPLITKLPIQSQSNEMPNEKLKERIINLKKELNKKNHELHELKLSNNKLEMEKESNLSRIHMKSFILTLKRLSVIVSSIFRYGTHFLFLI